MVAVREAPEFVAARRRAVKKKRQKVSTLRSERQFAEAEQPRVELPDFRARMRRIYGNKVFSVSGADLIRQDRDRY